MKVFIVELDDLENATKGWSDKFIELLIENRLEFWNYFSHQFALATPDSFKPKEILDMLLACTGGKAHAYVFEINLKDYAGYGPKNFLVFFALIEHPKYIPVWESKSDHPYGPSRIIEMEGIPESLKQQFINS